MKTLAGVAATPSPLTEPLPDVFAPFAEAKIRPRRGATTMIAATPGSAKTFLITKWVIDMGLPTLFFSADTDMQTMVARGAAIVSGDVQDQVRRDLRTSGAYHYVDMLNEKASHVRWVFESDPTYDDLEAEATAFAEVHGDFPQVIVVDTLMKVVGENDNEWSAMRQVTKVLERLNRVTGSANFVLHHMSDNKKDPSYPSPRSDIQGKVSQTARLILSLATDKATGEMRVAKVKDSWSTHMEDPSGETYLSLWVDLDRGQFFRSAYDRSVGNAI